MTVLTEPELGYVGLIAAQAEAALGKAAVADTRYGYTTGSRVRIYGETQGFIKLVFNRRDARRQSRCKLPLPRNPERPICRPPTPWVNAGGASDETDDEPRRAK